MLVFVDRSARHKEPRCFLLVYLLVIIMNAFEQVWREARSGRKKMSVKWLKRLHEYHPDLAQVAIQLNQEDGFVMAAEKPKKGAAEGGGSAATASSSVPAAPDATEQDRGRAKTKKEKRASSSKSRSKSKSKEPRSSSKSGTKAGGGAGSSETRELNMDGRKKHSTNAHDMALEEMSGLAHGAGLKEPFHDNNNSLLRSSAGIALQKGYGSADAHASAALKPGSMVVRDDGDGASDSDGEEETKGGKRKIAAVAVGASSSFSTVISMEEDSQLDLP